MDTNDQFGGADQAVGVGHPDRDAASENLADLSTSEIEAKAGRLRVGTKRETVPAPGDLQRGPQVLCAKRIAPGQRSRSLHHRDLAGTRNSNLGTAGDHHEGTACKDATAGHLQPRIGGHHFLTFGDEDLPWNQCSRPAAGTRVGVGDVDARDDDPLYEKDKAQGR